MNNLNRKTIIQLVVVIVGFAGSGFVIYNGMLKKSPTALPAISMMGSVTPVASNGNSGESVFPYGDTLDFKGVLGKQDLNYGTLTYPKLDANLDIGVSEQDLISVPESSSKTQ